MNPPLLAMPIDIFLQFRLGPGTKLEIVTTQDGFSELNVMRGNIALATFRIPGLVDPITVETRLCAANASSMNSNTGREDQWWDDGMLEEPLEPLAELEL